MKQALPLREIALVALGGALGAVARYALSLVIPASDGIPVATLTANLAGAFLLGLMTFWLGARGTDVGGRRNARLFLGTGVLGGFTTYSLLAVELGEFVLAQNWTLAAIYASTTLVGGALASLLGMIAGDAIGRGQPEAEIGADHA
ncbi:CrcB family protein [Leucobacter sp. cx-328]|uniref:fluoride efflux transporter FluC n=1 Tax=unclassified Leucobacter TaxID=2621730 RepID=UPI00165D47BA|nr:MULTISPECIES: CrcB family protein [unclassified Leucobacter]MBC9943974.1 CrcB family protein [Leucobacter sp. cx-328]